MAVYLNDDAVSFPPVSMADEDGLLAVGGQLSTRLLLTAYQQGIFPWYNEGEPVCWWNPDPRFVLLPGYLRVSKSMQTLLRRNIFRFTINEAFEQVIKHCKNIERPGQGGTWIQPDVVEAYTALHRMGYAISAEVWKDGVLVGGLYGILLGKVFFGESMFSQVSNASKYAFIKLAQHLQQQGIVLIDCQVYTEHLESLGAGYITRAEFMCCLQQFVPAAQE